jgi:aquaporin Z
LTTSTPPSPSGHLASRGRLFRDRRAKPRPEPGAAPTSEADLSLLDTLRRHWPEYAVEAGFLAVFLLGAGLASAWLEGPAPAADLGARRLLAGIAMGLVIAAMIYSPWGRRSGTHLNPAITLAYLRLGKIGHWDALFYSTAQVAGAAVAVAILRTGMPGWLPVAMPRATLSTSIGPASEWTAFTTELVLAASAMLMILYTSNHTRWFRWTGWLFAAVVALIVACGAPLSGFGMNLARLLAVDASNLANANWFNLLPPLLGMQLAVEAYRLFTGRSQVLCAKLAHNTHGKCIFRCQHPYQTRTLAMEALRRTGAGSRR